jgi:hypothetical protein
MSRFWRRAAPLVAVAGLIAAGAVPAEAASTTSPYGVTISATSPNYPFGTAHGKVDGYALVLYGDTSKNADSATISGAVSGAVAGDVATLLAEPFGKKSFTATSTTLTLNPAGTSPTPYSFAVQPTLATAYEVQITTGATVDATSVAQTVYVTESIGGSRFLTKCKRGTCKSIWNYAEELPAVAYRTEAAKRKYLYFDVDTKLPKFPRFMSLARSAKFSRAHRLAAHEFYFTVTFSYKTRLKHPNRDDIYTICTKDTESKDGLGLPGHHGCGAPRVKTTAPYVG